jgi:hypothetical protein
LYRYEAWSLTVREDGRNGVLRGICGSRRDEVTGGWRKLHNVELHKLYTLPKMITIKTKRML